MPLQMNSSSNSVKHFGGNKMIARWRPPANDRRATRITGATRALRGACLKTTRYFEEFMPHESFPPGNHFPLQLRAGRYHLTAPSGPAELVQPKACVHRRQYRHEHEVVQGLRPSRNGTAKSNVSCALLSVEPDQDDVTIVDGPPEVFDFNEIERQHGYGT